MKILKLKIPDQLIVSANNSVPKKAYNKRSITDGQRNVIGVLAELCTIHTFSIVNPTVYSGIRYEPCHDYDMTFNGVKVDIKTKQRTVPPKLDYDASIVAYSKDMQGCDAYMFTSITVEKGSGRFKDFYMIGLISKEEYFQKATFMKKGDPDGGNMIYKNGQMVPFTIVEDCYNLKYSNLKSVVGKKSIPTHLDVSIVNLS